MPIPQINLPRISTRDIAANVREFGANAARGAKALATNSKAYISDVVRAHYNIIGQYTFPIEQRFFDREPPKPSERNVLGQVLLTIPVPLIPLTYLSALIFVPLVANTGLSIIEGVTFMLNQSLRGTGKKFESENPVFTKRTIPERVYGSFGTIMGLSFGLCAGAAVTFGRIVGDSCISGYRLFNTMVSGVLHEKDVYDDHYHIHKNDDRDEIRRFGLGAPGLLIGAIAGAIGSLVVAVGRTISNSIESGARVFKSMVNVPLHSTESFKEEEGFNKADTRHWFRKYVIGSPGILIGGVVGGLGMLTVATARTISNSFESGMRVFKSLVNVPLHSTERFKEEQGFNKADTRHWFRKYVIGSPGILIGGVVGGLGMLTVAAARTISNSFESGKRIFKTMSNSVLPTSPRFEDKDCLSPTDTRHPFRKYGIGAPGLLLGALAGGLSIVTICAARTVTNNVKTATRLFNTISNFPLHKSDEVFKNYRLNAADSRPWYRKYLISIPGLIIGGALGCVAAVAVSVGRVVTQSAKSYRALSGSLLNGVADAPAFEGLSGDARNGLEQAVGGLGYVAAAVTTGPVATVGFLAKNSPDVGSLMTAVVLSPITTLSKGVSKGIKEAQHIDRFAYRNEENDVVIQRFKNLYSCLDGNGNFVLDMDIPDNATGKKSGLSHVRKCLTLNSSTVTERMLDAFLKEYRNTQTGFQVSAAWDGMVQEIKLSYVTGCFSWKKAAKEQQAQVQAVADFVIDYLGGGDVKKTPKDLYVVKGKPTWTAAFFGSKHPDFLPAAPRPVVDPVMADGQEPDWALNSQQQPVTVK